MKTITLFIISLFFIFPFTAQAGFDWGGSGGGCSENTESNPGSGSFQQEILKNDKVEVGKIPVGIVGVYINLTSASDVDIQLYDELTNTPIAVWPNGIMNGSGKQTANYQGMNIEWSGYNGDGSNYGHEYIKITGATTRSLVMKAFGYKAGSAQVDYSWTGTETQECEGGEGSGNSESGTGTFEQQILNKAVVTVGDIPTGIESLIIELSSDKDVDIQLYDGDSDVAIIAWPNGILNGLGKQTTNYHGMVIEWSGYNGDGTGKGHEYIKITGATTRNLVMKAYGYAAGFATIDYSWGGDDQSGGGGGLASEFQEALDLVNAARAVARQCGDHGFFPVAAPLAWNTKLYNAALGHSDNMANLNFFSHTGQDGSSAGDRISAQDYNWNSYNENIAAGQATVEIAVQAWIDSPGHCANIMSQSIDEMGLGHVYLSTSQYKNFWTMNGARD